MKVKGIILFGDSVFFGYGASDKSKGCGRVLRKIYISAPILIKAKNNDSTVDALNRLKNDVLLRKEYSHVFILFGNNDSRLVDLNKPVCDLRLYEKNLRQMVMNIKKNGKIPIMCNLQPLDDELSYKTLPGMGKYLNSDSTPDEWHKQYSDRVVEVGRSLNISVVDIEKALRSFGSKVIFDDGLHPNDFGHSIIAELLKKELIRQEKT
jgi:lysophospholipase L1-like esterase